MAIRFSLICFLFVFYPITVEGDDPPGHGKPFGKHIPPVGEVPVLEDFPHPIEFYKRYVKPMKPVLFRGVLDRIKFPAYTKWTDEYLSKTFGNIMIEVEEGKKENRDFGMERMSLKKFLNIYKTKDIYLVNDLPMSMKADINLPKCLLCGGFGDTLTKVIAWFSSGGTKSVLHNDEFDNINCLLDGTKELIFINSDQEEAVMKDGWIEERGYSSMDVDSVDMYKYPAFRNIPWYSARMEKGDCLFIPNRWFHQVNSFGDRNLAVNIWFYPLSWFNRTDCAKGSGVNEEVSINKYVLKNISEYARTLLLTTLPDADVISKEEFDEGWDEIIPNYNVKMEVFNNFDTDQDGLLSWKELYAFDLHDFVKTYKKNIGNDYMANYRRITDEMAELWAGSENDEITNTKEEL
ncbi:bifunctional peptidase and arginyl-hydroxylase JMJD5-like [Gigantopelta aegis]|uniref:bifunctional peptidase and arginyl-hydroxylase JMJD5-like n=1 Tax=Gigantopelta aegis TaxID=1735272 RepID=UPI001B88CD5E|nr:bifunctional peptidase and arginyl-hydroxylase JMJD5-like [Gigantopelta aegis]